MTIREELMQNADEGYKSFHAKLVPTIDADLILGVRVPVLRKIARKAAAEQSEITPYYYEEKMICGMRIGYEKCSLQKRLLDLEMFVPLIDNWAVCDCCASTYKFVNKNQEAVWEFLMPYLGKSEYEVRFAVVMLMDYFLDDTYIDRVIEIFSSIKSDAYYVNMAVAWALSVAFIRYKEKVYELLESNILSTEIHNKAIQKIRESNRVDQEEKEAVLRLKR